MARSRSLYTGTVGCRCGALHETVDETMARNSRVLAALCGPRRRDLTLGELAALLPPRNPTGCLQNRVRGLVIAALNRRGFTVEGAWCR